MAEPASDGGSVNRLRRFQMTEVSMKSFESESLSQLHAQPVGVAERERLEQEARRMRTEAVGHRCWRPLAALSSRFLRSLFGFVEAFADGLAAKRLNDELVRLDDAELRERGIAREEIGRYVAESMGWRSRREEVAPPAAVLSVINGGHGEPASQSDEPRPHRRAA
jgi:hypothetical protein